MAGKREAGLRHADGKQSREEEGQTTRFTRHPISTCELQNQSTVTVPQRQEQLQAVILLQARRTSPRCRE